MMRLTTAVTGLLLLVAIAACGPGRPTEIPEVREGGFAVTLYTEAYPSPAPDVQAKIWGDGSGSYLVVFKQPRPGKVQGTFNLTPEQIDEIYAVVREAEFFKLDEEYIADPPLPGRGVDVVRISASGTTVEVRSEYAEVPGLDAVRAAVMKAIPEEAYSGKGAGRGLTQKFVVDRNTKRIHAGDSPEVESIPEADRIYFDSYYEALDAGYHPSPELRDADR
jgi:hypothetical protein